jgi:hypothetical protein
MPNSFEDSRVQFPSSYCFNRQICQIFVEALKSPGNVPANRKKGITIQKRIVNALLAFKSVLQV